MNDFPGNRLTDYTSEELQTALNSIVLTIVLIEKSGIYGHYNMEHLNQWRVKLSEAIGVVRSSELINEN